MKKIQSNLRYFEISKNNPEPHLDADYFIIQKSPQMKQYIRNIKDIKEILITIKKLKENKENSDVLEKYFKKLFETFNEFSNCSELGCFVNACDTTRDLIEKDFESFKKITELFINNRILDDKAPENWIQAIIDNNASKKKGELGQNKLVRILGKFGYKLVKGWNDFFKYRKCVAIISKDSFSTEKIREKLKIKIDTENDDKMFDLLIRNKNKIFILEAKHLNVGGGEQDKQTDELIKILELKEINNNISYISFLDGTYSNKLISQPLPNRSKRMIKKRARIIRYLKSKKSKNYWVNTAGFKQLILDLR